MTEETIQIIVKELLKQREILVTAMSDDEMFLADRNQLAIQVENIDAKLAPYFESRISK